MAYQGDGYGAGPTLIDSGREANSVRRVLHPLTPLAFLERSAEVVPDKTAIVHGDRRVSCRPSTLTGRCSRPW
jgi:hypothetical protein